MQSDTPRQDLRCAMQNAVAGQNAAAAVKAARQLLAASSRPSDVLFCATAFSTMADALAKQLGARRLRTCIVRSVTLEPVLPSLAVEAALENYVLDIQVGGYGSYVDELLNPVSALGNFQPELILIVLDLEEIAGRLPDLCADGVGSEVEMEVEACVARIGQLLRGFRAHSSAQILFQGLVVPDCTSLGDVAEANLPHSLTAAIQSLNRKLAALCGTVSGCIFFDVDRLAARDGRARWRDERMFFASRLPVAAESFRAYSRGLVRSFSALFRAPRKVLCTDLDNTLWGGVLGEDGPNEIVTGSAFPGNCYLEYQKYLKQLSARGVLLAIVSKNNEADVREAFNVRAADLALSLDDFIARRINWNEKADSIREIARELSLGLDSFVFVDDSRVECEAVRQLLPEVAAVEAPAMQPWKLVEALSEGAFFDVATVTGEDVRRVVEYRAQAQRAELASSTIGRDAFLASLGIVCSFQSALQAPLARSVQLLAKTNQFNLTSRRYSAAEVEEFASMAGGQAVAARVRDRFGDSGVVGLALARKQGDSCLIDSLLLSCRAIGRGIETALLAHVGEQALRSGAKRLVGEFIATNKNSPCADFYPNHGFIRISLPENASPVSKFYELDLTVSPPTSPKWIALEDH